MGEIVLTTYDWVPDMPRGYVRDLRIRWALEEAGLPYRVESAPFRDRGPEHFARQPFGQVPFLTDGESEMFESGAILIHLGERSDMLMPRDPTERMQVIQWIFGALNSVEMAALPWSLLEFGGEGATGREMIEGFLGARLGHLEAVLEGREWLTDRFSVADILMVDVMRLVDRFDRLADLPNCRAYKERGEARPAFQKAHADQMAHFAAAD